MSKNTTPTFPSGHAPLPPFARLDRVTRIGPPNHLHSAPNPLQHRSLPSFLRNRRPLSTNHSQPKGLQSPASAETCHQVGFQSGPQFSIAAFISITTWDFLKLDVMQHANAAKSALAVAACQPALNCNLILRLHPIFCIIESKRNEWFREQ